MFYDLLAMDLSGFDVRAVPHTAAKAQQQALSLAGTDAWLYHVLQEGAIGYMNWEGAGLTVSKDDAYGCYEDFSKQQHALATRDQSCVVEKNPCCARPLRGRYETQNRQ